MSALEVILPLLQKMWLTMSKMTGAKLDEITDLSREIEQKMRKSEGWEVSKKDSESPILKEPLPTPKAPFFSLGKARRFKPHGSGGPTKDTTNLPRLYIPKLLTADEMPDPEVESPWFFHQSKREARESQQLQQAKANRASASQSSSQTEAPNAAIWQKRWDTTPRSQRVSLLNVDEQRLVSQLAGADISAKDKRKVFSQLSATPVERQRMIIECSKAMESGKA
jgi:hypothetical protein